MEVVRPTPTTVDDLLALADSLRSALDDVLSTYELNYTHYLVLREIYAVGSASPANLAKRLGLTRAGVKKTLQKLIMGDKPLLENKSASLRAIEVSLTKAGRTLYPVLAREVNFFSGRTYWIGQRDANRLADLVRLARSARADILSSRLEVARARTKMKASGRK